MNSILIPGGLGYVGSHTILDIFLQTDFHIVIVDDLSNCSVSVLERMKVILAAAGRSTEYINSRLAFQQGTVLDLAFLKTVFESSRTTGKPITTIIHFAAKKSVPESTSHPILYYENNLVGSLNLFKCMEAFDECKNFIFSSTATVYGEKDGCSETDPINPIHPYSESKVCVEMLMKSLAVAHKDWKMITLRYFNPCSSHPSGLIGDYPSGFPSNLFPFIQEVILGNRPKLYVFGTDYETHDGTGVRDYLHIMDLSTGHLAALKKLKYLQGGYYNYNLGTGKGLSVMDIIKGFEAELGYNLPYELTGRRPGDVSVLVARVEKANKELGWHAEKTLSDMCKDCLTFIKKSPVKHAENPEPSTPIAKLTNDLAATSV